MDRDQAIRDDKRLIERDDDERVRLEAWTIPDYLDTAPLRELSGEFRSSVERIAP